jgi:hypothetical protein
MQISSSRCNFEREPLVAPFGFKGGYLTEGWQSAVLFNDAAGTEGIGLGTQSVLWSDPQVFLSYPEAAGNSIMFLMTAFAAVQAAKMSWDTPSQLLRQLLPLTYEYGKTISGNKHLRLTFALNALVPVDNAAWMLYARSKKITDFDEVIPSTARQALSFRQEKLAAIPLLTYGVTGEQIAAILDAGFCVLKIKIGSDPDKDGNLDKMLEWDKNRVTQIHELAKRYTTPYTANGKLAYYLDANGRYDSKDRILKLIRHIEQIGAMDQVLLCEEPFPEECKLDVSDMPVCVVADESAHTDKDCVERIELGYKAIALKPIAKTMSMSLEIARIAHERQVGCFCADLTVNPVMVDWNKNVAARLKPLKGMKTGILESNGHQNYKNWKQLQSYHPCSGASWMNIDNGMFMLNDDFFAKSGGIFFISEHYRKLCT